MTHGLVVISGCSCGGKSTLLAELNARGHSVVAEPGRRVIDEERTSRGNALPWLDLEAFLRRAVVMAHADHASSAAKARGWTFFDRGLVDAASALESLTGDPATRSLRNANRYHPCIFFAPPWPEIYETDADRRHGFDTAEAECWRLATVYPALGYELVELPKTTTCRRADFVLASLAGARNRGR